MRKLESKIQGGKEGKAEIEIEKERRKNKEKR